MVKNDDLLRDVPLVEGFKVLGPCVLLDRLGEGGMGAVYLGWHLNLQIFVAVKCLKRISSDHQQVERFRGEAKVLAKISAPNLIRVFDVTESAGLHFIVMEYVEGETAAERVQRKGALPLRDGLTIAYKAAKGLAATHEAGVIHRDIKPDNILLSRKGHVRLADLGIAKADHELNPVHTQSNVLMGTPNYMAPEQWDGAKQVSPRADVYAMGLSTYHMLTGTVPFQAASLFSVGKRVQAGELTDLAIKRPDASDALVQLIRSTTAVDPAERPEDGTALAAALGAELEHLGGPARLIDPGIGATARKAVRPSGDVLNAITAAMERAPGTREAYPPTIDVGERAYPPTVAYGSSAAAAAATATAAAQAAKATTATHEKPRRRWLAPVLITAVLAVIAIPAALLLLPLLRGGGTAETGDLRASSEAPTTPGSIGGAGPNGGSGDAGAAGAGARAADRSDSGGTGSAGSADSPAPPDAPDTPAAALRAQIDAGAWDEALETLRRFAGERTLTQAQLVGFLDETIVGLGHDLRANPALWDAPLDERLVALAGIWPEHVTTFLAETIRDHDEPSLSRFLDVTRLLEPEVTAGRLSSRDVRKLADPLLEDAAPKPVEWTEQNKADLSWATTNGSHEGFAILAEGLAHLETVSDASIFVDLHAAARRAIELGCMDRTEAAALTEDLVRRFPAERIEASWTDELEAALAWLHAELPSPPAGVLLARGRCRGKTHDGCASVLEAVDLVMDLRQQGALGDAAARDDLNAVLGRSASLVTDDAACRELYPVLHQVARAPLRSAGAAAIVLEREARRFGEAGTCSATDFAGWVELWTLAKAESATRIDRLRSLADETCRGPLRQSLGAVFGNELPLPGGGAAGEVGAAGAHGANAASATVVTLPETTRTALRELKDYSPEARLLLAESLISYEWLDSGYSYPIVDAFVPKDPIEIRELLDGAEHPRARLYAGDLFIQPEVFGDLDREEARARGYDQLEQAARDGLADAHARLGLLMVIPDSKYRPDIVGGKARTDAGLEFLERAARGGSVRGKGWFGMFSLWIVPADMRAHDDEVYRTYLRDAAASGFQPAANFLDEGPPAAPAAP